MKYFFRKYILVIILLTSALLRLWNLGNVPPGITADEAALGYNAYSILKTGRDEYGKILPVIFKSFGDYKPGLYIYLTAPFVAVFGLNEWSVRLPSALAGVGAVWLLYLIIRKLKNENLGIRNSKLEIVAGFLLAVNPWHIQFSRGAWEVNVALTLTLAGIYFFLKLQDSIKYLKYCVVFFALTLVTYQGAKLSSLIVIAILVILYWNELLKKLKDKFSDLILPVVLGAIISLPILFSLFTGQTGRLEVFSVFSYPRPHDYLQNFLSEGNEKLGSVSYYLFHSETLNFTRGVFGRWFNHFSGGFLFFEGDWPNPRHTPPNHGTLLLIDLILIPLGFLSLVKFKNKFSVFVLWWLVLSLLPAVLSRDAVQAVRAYNMLIPLVIISSLGACYFFDFAANRKNQILSYFCDASAAVIFLASFAYYMDAYLVHMRAHNARYWEYGMKEVVQTVLPIQTNYDRVIVQQSYAQPYIYFLFYGKYDPAQYQKNSKLTNYLGPDVGLVDKLDNIEFSFYSWPVTPKQNTLIVGTPVVIVDFNPADYDLIKEIKYPSGEVAYKILSTRNKNHD